MPFMAPQFPYATQLDVMDPKKRDHRITTGRNDSGIWQLPPTDLPPVTGYTSKNTPLYGQAHPDAMTNTGVMRDIDPGISAQSKNQFNSPQIQQVIDALMGKQI